MALNPGLLPSQKNLKSNDQVFLPDMHGETEVGGIRYRLTQDTWSRIIAAFNPRTRGVQEVFPPNATVYTITDFLKDKGYVPRVDITESYLKRSVEIHQKLHPRKKITQGPLPIYEEYSGQFYARPDDIIECSGTQYIPNGDNWNAVSQAFEHRNRGADKLWPVNANSYSLSEWLHDNNYEKRRPDITAEYLHHIVTIYQEMNNGKLPGWSEGFGEVFVIWNGDGRPDDSSEVITVGDNIYLPNGDTWNSVGQAIRNGSRGAKAVWPASFPDGKRYGLSQWLKDNGYKQ